MKTFSTHAEKAIRRFRKILRRFPAHPSIEQVHELRSHARRFEAIASTLAIDHDGSRHLLKAVKAIHKAAGAVRDMDVLSQDALTLSPGAKQRHLDETSVLRLLHDLHFERMRFARKLNSIVKKQRTAVADGLKQVSRELRKQLKVQGGKVPGLDAASHLEGAAIMDLMLDLRLWPELSAENLHPFRLKVKTLRILLKLADGPAALIVRDLGATKDLIGEWHDWLELGKIAEQALTAKDDLPVLGKIRSITANKLKLALSSAETLMDRHIRFNPSQRAA